MKYDTLDFHGYTYEVVDIIYEFNEVIVIGADGNEEVVNADEIEIQDECFYEKYFYEHFN